MAYVRYCICNVHACIDGHVRSCKSPCISHGESRDADRQAEMDHLIAHPSRFRKNIAIKSGVAALFVSSDGERFVMTGPSGRHSLLVVATDLDRLNAHWRVFAADSRNRIEEPRA